MSMLDKLIDLFSSNTIVQSNNRFNGDLVAGSIRVSGCKNIVQKNGKTYINGKLAARNEPAEIIVEGNVINLNCRNAAITGNVKNNVDCTNLKCENIGGDVNCTNVTCKSINGNVDATNVKHITV